MQTQSRQIGEQWSQIRDFQSRGVSKDDARELFHICQVEFLPPSKAHKRRLERPRPRVVEAHAKPAPPQVERAAMVQTLARGKAIAAINNPHRCGFTQSHETVRKSHAHVFSAKHGEALVKGEAAECSIRRNRRREHYRALGMMCYRKADFTLDNYCEIFHLFGDYKAFRRYCGD